MDVSELYTKMCEKAYPELKQNIPLFSRRRRMYYAIDGTVGLWWDVVDISNCERARPLWEQDQLQEMIGLSPPSLIHKIFDFMESRYPPDVSDEDWQLAEMVFNTWEQLWLAFAMLTLCSKRWDGNEWIKI